MQKRQLWGAGLGTLAFLASCQTPSHIYLRDPATIIREDLTPHALQAIVSCSPPVVLELRPQESLPHRSLTLSPNTPSLEQRTLGVPQDKSLLPQPPLYSPQDPSKNPKAPYTVGAVGPLALTAQPSSFSGTAPTFQVQVPSIPYLGFSPNYLFDDGSRFFSSQPFGDSWYIDGSVGDPKQQKIPFSRLGKALKRYLLEDSKNPLAQTYRNAMKGLANVSDGPAQWLFGEQVSTDVDFRLDSQRAGLYFKVNFSDRDKFLLGYEQGVFGDNPWSNNNEPSAVLFNVTHGFGGEKKVMSLFPYR